MPAHVLKTVALVWFCVCVFVLFCAQNFAKYVEVVRKNVTRGLSLGLLFTHIAEKEGLKVIH